jgi:phosphomannomutase
MKTQTQQSIPDKILSAANSIEQIPKEKTREKLIALINELINKDFQSLIQLLYRIDVNEKKIRVYLDANADKDSATVLADLIIERQLQKIESRKKFNEKNNAEDDEEKW